MSKPHANDDETILLAEIKRQRAREALLHIAQGLAEMPPRIPTVALLLDYLNNMIFAIELILKLLSSNWQNHQIGDMYKTVFGVKYANQLLMNSLRDAILSQKYLFEPSVGLHDSIPEIESLFQTIHQEMVRRYPNYQVVKGVSLPKTFGEFLKTLLPESVQSGIDHYLASAKYVVFQEAKMLLSDMAKGDDVFVVMSRTCACGEPQVSDDGTNWYCPKCKNIVARKP